MKTIEITGTTNADYIIYKGFVSQCFFQINVEFKNLHVYLSKKLGKHVDLW